MVVDAGVPAIRVFEVASAAQPTGLALEVVDPAGTTRAFAYRVGDPRDHETTIINDPIDLKIDRDGIHVSGPTEPAHELALGASVSEVAAAVVAVAPSQGAMIRWGFVELVDPKAPVAVAISAIEGLAAANVSGVSFLAGKPGIPELEIVTAAGEKARATRHNLMWKRREIMACYTSWLSGHPDRDGRIDLAWSVGADGLATDVRATQVDLDDTVATCIAAVIAHVNTGGLSGPVTARLYLTPDVGSPPSHR